MPFAANAVKRVWTFLHKASRDEGGDQIADFIPL